MESAASWRHRCIALRCSAVHERFPHLDRPVLGLVAVVGLAGGLVGAAYVSGLHLLELVVGPDDSGQTRPTDAALVGARDEAAVARLIAEQVGHPDRPATDAELAAAGFDPAPRYRAQRPAG